MLKLLVGVAIGAIFRDAMIQVYRRNNIPHQDRLEAAYNILRYGVN